ncbi:MAG: class IV adenylate cyclase, partial [Isosphaeraceae bacterium]
MLNRMGYEVEIKFRVPDHDALVRRLAELGVAPGPPIEQEDAYLAHPGRNFAKSDEALRLRRVGTQNRITYKGPKRGGPTKTREEIEVPFADGDESLA